MPDPALLARLRAEVDAGFAAETAFLQALVRFPSTRGNEAPLQDWMAGQLAARGYAVDRFTLADVPLAQHPNASPMVGADPARSVQVVGTRRSAHATGRSLILQGHIDVVPPGPEAMWAHPPFAAVIQDGWMHGRGAYDMKAGVACMVFAMDALDRAGVRLAGDVHVQTVTEEESTGNGALATLVRGYRADACLIPESTGNLLGRAHTGTIWFRIRARGVPVHVMAAQDGTNAIMSAYKLILALQAHTAALNQAAKDHPWYKDVSDPVKFNPGVIRGGDWASSTPSWCEVDCRLGLLPGTSVAEAQAGILHTVRMAARDDAFLGNHPPDVEWIGFLADGQVLAPGSAAEQVLAQAHQAVHGTEMQARLGTAVNDTRFYALYYGISALCYGPDGIGPHEFDERVRLDSLRSTTLTIAAFVAEWCGVVE